MKNRFNPVEYANEIAALMNSSKYQSAILLALQLDKASGASVLSSMELRVPVTCTPDDFDIVGSAVLIETFLEKGYLDYNVFMDKLESLVISSEQGNIGDDVEGEGAPEFRILGCILAVSSIMSKITGNDDIKSELYRSDDSVLSSYMNEKLDYIMETQGEMIEGIIKGQIYEYPIISKLSAAAKSHSTGVAAIMKRFFGKKKIFKIIFGICASLAALSTILFLYFSSKNSKIIAFISSDKNIMKYVLLMEIFLIAGMIFLAATLFSSSFSSKKQSKRNVKK